VAAAVGAMGAGREWANSETRTDLSASGTASPAPALATVASWSARTVRGPDCLGTTG
jgi:hypothetical protein